MGSIANTLRISDRELQIIKEFSMIGKDSQSGELKISMHTVHTSFGTSVSKARRQ